MRKVKNAEPNQTEVPETANMLESVWKNIK